MARRTGSVMWLLSVVVLGCCVPPVVPECANPGTVNTARDEIIDEVQSSTQQIAQLAIAIERLEDKIERFAKECRQRLAGELAPVSPMPSSASFSEGMDGRLRSLEGSVTSLQRRLDEKLDLSVQRVVDVESKRAQQEKVFTDILTKILNTVNTVYERIHTGGESRTRSGQRTNSVVQRAPMEQQQIILLQDSMESLSREFKEKLDVLQGKLADSINEVNMYTRMASEKVAYISENMVLNEDVQRTLDESKPRGIDTEKVLEVVREGMKHCTRAMVNAPQDQLQLPQVASGRSISNVPTTTAAPELAFYVGPKRDDCKMTAAIKMPHNCDQLGQAGANCDGPYMVYDSNGKKAMKVLCDMSGGQWTVLMKRGSAKGKPLSFDRSWSSYKFGFGNIDDEFYVGNEYMHKLTDTPKRLRIELESFSGEQLTLDYANFTVGPESDHYRMRVGTYLGNNPRVGNAFRRHNDKQFLTKDRLSGPSQSHKCPQDHNAGHWWHSCYSVLLTGEYATPQQANAKNGIRWATWKAEPLKGVILKIKDMS